MKKQLDHLCDLEGKKITGIYNDTQEIFLATKDSFIGIKIEEGYYDRQCLVIIPEEDFKPLENREICRKLKICSNAEMREYVAEADELTKQSEKASRKKQYAEYLRLKKIYEQKEEKEE